ncbi:hypothetical protein WJX77_009283 [Trebouxia sp. C0004]
MFTAAKLTPCCDDASGSGANPISTAVQYGIATDECPECLSGSLDLAQDGDGRWTIDWYPVQCNVGDSYFQYSFQGSNAEYVKMAITNTRVPAAAVSIKVDGVYQAMTKTVDNYWLADSSAYTFPASVQVTSVLGDTVTDVVNVASPSGAVVGAAQFPLSSSYDVVGGAAATTSPASSPTATPETVTSPTSTAELTTEPTAAATTSPIAEPTTAATKAPTAEPTAEPATAATKAPTAEPTAAATTAPTAEPTAAATTAPTAEPTAAATTAPTAEPSATPTPTAESVSTIPIPTSTAESPTTTSTSEPASPNTTSTPQSPTPASSNASSPAAPYASATTNYSVNASVPAPPIPPSAEIIPSPAAVPAGTQQASTIVANVSSPAVHATAPTVAVTSQVNGEASVPGTVNSSAVTATSTPDGDTGLVTTPAICTLSVAALQQCGGRGGVCANQGANSSQCKDAEWDNACCTSGYYCKRSQQWSWTCQRTEANTTQTVGGVVADYHQCGGLGNCAESLCADAEWAEYSCYSGFACLRWDAFYWQCRDVPFAQAA